jgi:hypothetical protein
LSSDPAENSRLTRTRYSELLGLGQAPSHVRLRYSSGPEVEVLGPEPTPPLEEQALLLPTMATEMPKPNKPGSPFFDGTNPGDIIGFIDEFEYHAKKANLNDGEKKKEIGRYTKLSIREIWEAQPQFANEAGTFEQYKKDILSKYPEVDEKGKYSIAKFNSYVATWRAKRMRDLAEFGQFDRGFDLRASWIGTGERWSNGEKARLYWRAFSSAMQERLEDRIVSGNPGLDPQAEYSIDQIRKAVQWVLGRPRRRKHDSDDDGSDEEETPGFTKAEETALLMKRRGKLAASKAQWQEPEDVKIKKEETSVVKDILAQLNVQAEKDAEDRREIRSSLTALQNQMNRRANQPQAPVKAGIENQRWGAPSNNNFGTGNHFPIPNNVGSTAQPFSLNRPQTGNPNRPIFCAFCGSNEHSKMYCQELNRYEKEGRVKKDPNSNYLIMPSGVPIPRGPPGATLKERVDQAMHHVSFYESYFPNAALE